MSKRFVVVTLAFLLTLVASFGSAAQKVKKTADTAKVAEAPPPAEAKAPRLTIVEPVKDFGTVAKGDKIDWSFAVKNTGDADLQILAARPACGCTVADFDKVIKPGEMGKVTAHVDTTNFTGPITKSVTIETNDPNTPSSVLNLQAIVKPYVDALPAGFIRYNIIQGDAEMQTFTLVSDEEAPFEITKVDVPGDYVKVAWTKVDKPEDLLKAGRVGQNQYRFNVTLGGTNAPVGPLAERIRIQTNSTHQPEYLVSISGLVRPSIRVEPQAVNFGEVAPSDAAAVRTVLLHSMDAKTPAAFNVTRAESSTSAITAEVMPSTTPGDYQVSLKVARNAKPGDVIGTVKIYTTDKVNPVVTLPVSATVKSGGAAASSSK
jgi:hypothetical protein